MNKKLYIEYRVYFDPSTNQELLTELADLGQEAVYNLFDHNCDIDGNEFPSPHDVTYQLVVETPEPIVYWGTPINVQWHRVVDCIASGRANEAYAATLELVYQSKRMGNSY